MNLPNKITLSRVFGIIVFLFFLLNEKIPYHHYLAALVFAILAFTDTIDGIIARRHQQITDFGRFIDPLADKLLISSALIFLIPKIPAWIVFLILAREFAVLGLRLMVKEKRVIAANFWGKIKTFSQVIAILMVLLDLPFFYYFLLLSLVLTLFSGFVYFWKNKNLIKTI